MENTEKMEGLLAVMMHRFEVQLLPTTLSIKEKVDSGEPLSDWAAGFLEEVIENIRQAQSLVEHYPEFQPLYARVAGMYLEITQRALANESGQGGG